MRFDIDDWQREEWRGPLGCTKIRRFQGTTARIEFQGANRFRVTLMDGVEFTLLMAA